VRSPENIDVQSGWGYFLKEKISIETGSQFRIAP
jgi:hypothetical protein